MGTLPTIRDGTRALGERDGGARVCRGGNADQPTGQTTMCSQPGSPARIGFLRVSLDRVHRGKGSCSVLASKYAV